MIYRCPDCKQVETYEETPSVDRRAILRIDHHYTHPPTPCLETLPDGTPHTHKDTHANR